MILLIDNYDSFSYNLFQLIGKYESDIRVLRNDAVSAEEAVALKPKAIFLSPGPGRPEDSGICTDLIRAAAGKIPLLGVCLGHQAICTAFGGTVSYAGKIMHGKKSEVRLDKSCRIFRGLPERIPVGRYHSLCAVRNTLPECLCVTAETDDGEVMGVMHTEYPVYGLQFHPESILTPDGDTIIKNFMEDLNHDQRSNH
jgi:anthranilate synthase component 2